MISVSCALQPQPLGNKHRKRFNAWPKGFQFGNDDWHRKSHPFQHQEATLSVINLTSDGHVRSKQ